MKRAIGNIVMSIIGLTIAVFALEAAGVLSAKVVPVENLSICRIGQPNASDKTCIVDGDNHAINGAISGISSREVFRRDQINFTGGIAASVSAKGPNEQVNQPVAVNISCGGYRPARPIPGVRAKELENTQRHLQMVANAFHAYVDRRKMSLKHIDISAREIEVLHWLSEGLIAKEIAHKTQRNVHTVNKQIVSARNRLGAATTVQAVAKAVLLGLI